MKFTVDYYREEEVKGGVQSVFSQFRSIDGDFRNISYSNAAKALNLPLGIERLGHPGFEFQASMMIDRYLKYCEDLGLGLDLIVRNSIVGNFLRLETPQICVLQDNNVDGPDILRGFYDPVTWHMYRFCFTALQRKSMESARAIVAVSRDIARAYEGEFGVKCEVIEHGVDTDKFFPVSSKGELREKYGVPKDKKVGLFVGSFHPISGYHLVPPLARKLKDIFWIIVLKHPTDYRPRLENIRLLCNIERDRMNEIYNLADFLISPSYVESFNLKAVEAMATDLKVIVTKTGYFAEFEGEGDFFSTDFGFVVRRPSVDVFERAIRESFLRGYIFKGREHIRINQLDIESWRGRWKNLIEEAQNRE